MKTRSRELAGLDWQVFGGFEFEKFFRSLHLILPKEALLYFEGTAVAPDVKQYFNDRAVKPGFNIRRVTIFPKPSMVCLPFAPEIVEDLCQLSRLHDQMDLFEHFKAYERENLLIAAFEFNGDEPVLISSIFPESKIQEFASAIGCRYRKVLV